MNNEPYGWHCFDDVNDFLLMNGKGFSKPDASWNKIIPLYVSPSDLTDEEINKVFEEVYSTSIVPATRKSFEFARAILRKAQKK